MILTIENTSKVGKPCRVFDANDVELKFCVECNTENGVAVLLRRDGEDFVLQNGEIAREFREFSGPLRIEWLSTKVD